MPELEDQDIWVPGVFRLEQTTPVLGGVPDRLTGAGPSNWAAQDLANRTRYLYERHRERQLAAPIELTVGPGGDYATINEAALRLSLMSPQLQPVPVTGTIRLLAGFEMAEQLIVAGLNMGWVRIVADSGTVLIQRDALTMPVPTLDGDVYPAFAAVSGGVLPRIAALFSMTTDGSATGRAGLLAADGGQASVAAGCGIQSAGTVGMWSLTGGFIGAEGADFRNAGSDCVRATRAGTIAAMNATLSGAGTYGAFAFRSGRVEVEGANLTGAGLNGIRAARGGQISAFGADCRVGAVASTSDIAVIDGGLIFGHNVTAGVNVTINQTVPNGTVWSN